MIINNKTDEEAFTKSSPMGIVISNGDGIIEEVNSKTEQLFGFEQGELIGRPVECLMPDSLVEKHIKHRAGFYAQPFSRAMGAGLDLVGRKKNGDLFPIEIGLSYSHNRDSRVFGNCRDSEAVGYFCGSTTKIPPHLPPTPATPGEPDSIRVISYILDISKRKQIENISQANLDTQKKDNEREFQMGHQVQVSLLPKELPHIPRWSVSHQWQPANKIGGDFYDVIDRMDGEYDLLIADVTDKGIPAALFMAFANSLLRTSLNGHSSLLEGISRANQRICQDSNHGLYVTLFVARINAKKGEISYVNAGHNAPLHFSKRNGSFSNLSKTGMVLGVDPHAIYEQQTVQIEPMDFMVFYTDGVTEATNANGDDFGINRLQQVILRHCNAAPSEIVDSISKAVNAFIGPDTLKDDITIIVAKRE